MAHRILYLEDNFEIRTNMHRWLVDQGYDVVLCANEPELIAALAADHCDLLLLDRQIPSSTGRLCDGLIALRRARGAGLTAPAILMTAQFTQTDHMIEGQTDNLTQDYILKPVDPGLLRIKMRNLLAPLHHDPHRIRKGRWLLDAETKSVKVGPDTVTLTATEYATFSKLFDHFHPMHPERSDWVLTPQWDDLVGHHENPHDTLRARIRDLRARFKGTAGQGGIDTRKKVGPRDGGYKLVS